MATQVRTAWQQCSLGEVVTLHRGYDLPERERRPGAVPIVSSSGVTGYHDTSRVKGPGVVTGRYGTLGEVFYVVEDYWPLNTTLFVSDFKGNDPRFISYFLRTLNFGQQNAAGAVPGVNRNHLHLLPVTLPPLPTQRKIAGILSAYDDLIENNTRRIALLEEMARALYREWFVEFRYPGHEGAPLVESPLGAIPQGWRVVKLFDVAHVTYGFPFKSALFSDGEGASQVIRIRDVKAGRSNTYTSETADARYIVQNGDILVGMDGEFHMGKWAGGEAYLNQRVVCFRPRHGMSAYFLFLSLAKPIKHYESTIVGTTVAHLSDKDLRAISILTPVEHVAEQAMPIFDSLLSEEIILRERNANLRRARDLLLPKLVSGEVDVEGVEVEVGEDG